jgi:hypothetical protein
MLDKCSGENIVYLKRSSLLHCAVNTLIGSENELSIRVVLYSPKFAICVIISLA